MRQLNKELINKELINKELINKELNKQLMLAICSILILSSIATIAVAQTLQVSTDRYSLFAPYLAGSKASVGSLSSDFRAYALLLDDTGKPLSGINITFEILSAAGLVKATKYNITQQNGLASVSYDTNADFTSGTDTDYGTWIIKAFRTGSPTVTESTNMRIEAGGKAGGGCGQDNCHKTDTVSGAKPLSPYTEHYGQTSSRAVAAHKKNNHQNAGCPACHPGYASDKTAVGSDGKIYGKTADVHKNNTCEFCHGNWEYIKGSGNGIPKMPSCTQCHPVYNSNVKNINTLANLLAGNGISVFSFNYDTKTPLVAHNGTSDMLYSLTEAVPCISCHGPAHNNSKPYLSAGNSVTEDENCWSCHTDRATTHKSNTNCVGCHTQDAHNVSISISGGGGEPGNYTGSSSNCKGCHPSQYDKWAASTHTSKLITKEDAMARGYPNPPGGYSWDNVSFVIGSKWKIRYVNDTGYIITTGGMNQYNVDDQIWTDYNKDLVKKYNCGHCHTTGYLDNVSNTNKEPFKTLRSQGKIPNGVYDNSLTPGFVGYWAENSIGCEACHGQGGDHINSPSKFNIRNASQVRNNPEICGDCHNRGRSSKYGEYENFKPYPAGANDSLLDETLYDDSPMPTVNYGQVGGHHEQWEDWKSSGHANASKNCISCHGGHGVSDPAYSGGPTGKTKFTNGTVYPAAVNQSCVDCHSSELPKHGTYSSNSECISCHMPMNRKSSNKIDLRSHWFDIKALKDNKNGDIHAYNFNTLTGVTESCTYCHNSSVVNKPIYKTDVGKHKDVNKSEGIDILNSSDCKTCHYASTQTRICEDCHIDQVVSSPKVDEHNSRGLDVKVLEQCSLCHNNSINRYVYTANGSVAHYGTTTSLINTSNCIDCHNGPYTGDPKWGSPVNISTSTKRIHTETTTAECDNCHKDASVPTLAGVDFHNAAVRLGAGGDDCVGCHAGIE